MKNRLPDTDENIIFGHGNMTNEHLRRLDSVRRMAEYVVPGLRRSNNEAAERNLEGLMLFMPEINARNIRSLEKRHDLQLEDCIHIYIPGMKIEGHDDFQFSDIDAFVTYTNDGGAADLAHWTLHIPNPSNGSEALLYVQTSVDSSNPESELNQIEEISIFDPKTGHEFTEYDYDPVRRTELYSTVYETLQRINSELLPGYGDATVTKLSS